MKQTAVEFLVKGLPMVCWEDPYYSDLLEQAKEIEKQQQERMYSEEELKSAFKIGFNIAYGSPVQELDLKNQHCDNWFEQFKKK